MRDTLNLSIYLSFRRWTTTAASILDTFKLDVAMIASTDACLELASIGTHLPRDLEPGLAYRDALALPPPTCCPYATFDAQVRPCLCAAGLTVHAEAQGSPSPIDATLVAESAPVPLMGGPVASDGLRRTGTLTVGPEARGPRTNRIRPYITCHHYGANLPGLHLASTNTHNGYTHTFAPPPLDSAKGKRPT